MYAEEARRAGEEDGDRVLERRLRGGQEEMERGGKILNWRILEYIISYIQI